MTIITGGSGLLGNAFKKIVSDAYYPTHKELELTNKQNTDNYFKKHSGAHTVIHLAGMVGGVKANTERVSDFMKLILQ